MNTTQYLDILNQTVDRLLLDRAAIFTANDWYPLRTFHSERLREAWETFWWPDLMRVEEVTHGGAAFAFSGVTTDPIGSVESVWSSDPEESTTAMEVPYRLTSDGVLVMTDADPVWVRFRLPSPRLRGDVYDATVAYAVGAQVYWGGDFYDVVSVTTAGDTPATAATKFEVINIPEMFDAYLELGAAADFERSRRQMETAAYYERKAGEQLANRMSQWTAQMNQWPRVKVLRS